ncbi:hypothetical protein HS088_TW08G00861 [Tripterygium wilfordii]|uniref:Uncharacterized protein n=1 Tax=Tripterygium wilfordii TaxID=458696 RepID=A0A7J7DD71_TRIWF|nr:hypothetical protein HS088_TW08G00861 [Tripterygium wilfordii]
MENENDLQIKKILEHVGVKGAQEENTMKPTSTSNEVKEKYQTPHNEHSTDRFESVLKIATPNYLGTDVFTINSSF